MLLPPNVRSIREFALVHQQRESKNYGKESLQ